MKKETKYFKKAVSMMVAVGLIAGIANIPAYAAVSAISATKTTDAVLSQPYYTPAQLAKQVSAKTTANTTKKSKTKYFNANLNDVINGLKAGEKANVKIQCLNKKGKYVSTNIVTIIKEKNGKFSVIDKLINNGKKISYTKTEFKKLMQGKIATGITESGKKIKTPTYYNTTAGYVKYNPLNNNGTVYIATNSKIIADSYIKNEYNKSISIINGLLKIKL